MGMGMDMERDELLEDRAAFIAGEIGGAVVELIIDGATIDRDAIVGRLEAKRRSVGKSFTRGCCVMLRSSRGRGNKKPGAGPGMAFRSQGREA